MTYCALCGRQTVKRAGWQTTSIDPLSPQAYFCDTCPRVFARSTWALGHWIAGGQVGHTFAEPDFDRALRYFYQEQGP